MRGHRRPNTSRLDLELLEDRTLLHGLPVESCNVIGEYDSGADEVVEQQPISFFATSPSDPVALGTLSIGFPDGAIEWKSFDVVVGEINAQPLTRIYQRCSSRTNSQPRELVYVGYAHDALVGIRLQLEPKPLGEIHVGKGGRMIQYRLLNIDLDVDANRDGKVDVIEDEVDEDVWNAGRGAIFNVNFDRDGQRMADGMPLPDAIHFDNHGTPIHEDFHIENALDELDIAPLVVRNLSSGFRSDMSVVLRASDPTDLRRIHIYKKISAEPANVAIWGNATGDAPPPEINITQWVDPSLPTFEGDESRGDVTFGIEGLSFRNVGPNVPSSQLFDGYIDLVLELRRGGKTLAADSVRLKVAPWVMLSRDQPSEQIWSAAIGLRGRINHGTAEQLEDGETFTLSDGRVERVFEFDFEPHTETASGHVPVLITYDDSVRQVRDAIIQSINGVEGFRVLAAAPPRRLPVETSSDTTSVVNLFGMDLTTNASVITASTETVSDPQFSIVDLGGTTNRTLLESDFGNQGYVGLDYSGQLRRVFGPDAYNQWFQDHVEIGYTERPGGPKTHIAFRLPYWRGTTPANPAWPRTRLLGKDVGIFQLGVSLAGGSGDFGGNIEVLAPNSSDPLGRIVMGNRGSSRLRQFLHSQEVQSPIIELPVQWLRLGHVDEIVSFLPNNQIAISSPNTAWEQLLAIPNDRRASSVFFASGERPQSAVLAARSSWRDRIETGVDHRGHPWKYVRIIEGAAAGTVAEIDSLGDGFITVKKVWNTGSKITDGAGPQYDVNRWRTHKPPTSLGWTDAWPEKGDRYVLVEESQRWRSGTPAIIAVSEVLADHAFEQLNRKRVQSVLDEIRDILIANIPDDTVEFVELPALFFGNQDGVAGRGFTKGRSAEAFNPGPANLQLVDGIVFIGRQYGPPNETGIDTFERFIRESFGVTATTSIDPDEHDERLANEADSSESATIVNKTDVDPTFLSIRDVVFVDDWELYHIQNGNVHCGTVVKRALPESYWWIRS